MICALLFYLFIIFLKYFENNYTLNLFFIDNEKGIPHFYFDSLGYGYSDVYLQKCKLTGNLSLLHHDFALMLVSPKWLKLTWPFFKMLS